VFSFVCKKRGDLAGSVESTVAGGVIVIMMSNADDGSDDGSYVSAGSTQKNWVVRQSCGRSLGGVNCQWQSGAVPVRVAEERRS
jgi:hypothetical protein